ncbi:MAG: AmmeMemoRadiSam system radical SAM enzyme [Acidobacteria bacterium]|nr:AmmeMemoRadiSam system radical SAM enzyme [Acidobacteriota bacterium]
MEKSELDRLTRAVDDLAVAHPSGKLVCVACAHRCKLAEGARGICRVRFREHGRLHVPWGYTAGAAVDPIEKKPFFHVLPGSGALSFGMLGCDMRCDFCQNWMTSQTLRDPRATTRAHRVSEEELVEAALSSGSASVISTYNEPLITSEWARSIFGRARARGLRTGYVSNGHATTEVLEYLAPVLDMYKVDLKAFRERTYAKLGGRLSAVMETIGALHRMGIWTEVVTLVVPGLNDDPAELREMAQFIVSVSPGIPWHVTAFHPDYRLTGRGPTPARALADARTIGLEAGLQFVYAGNLPGSVPHGEDTLCPGCGAVLVERRGFQVLRNRIGADGRCPTCGHIIPGLWA